MRHIDSGGGLTVVEIVKANALAEKGHDVILCCSNGVNTDSVSRRPISPKVRLIDLHASDVGVTSKRSISFLNYLNSYRKKLQDVVDVEKPDVLVGTEYAGKYVAPFIRSPRGHKMVKVREYHYGSTRFKYLVTGKWRLLCHKLVHSLGYKVQSLLYDKIYLLTRRDKLENFPSNNKFDVMYNPLTVNVLPPPDTARTAVNSAGIKPRENVVIFVGRLEDCQKNLTGLLNIWAKTKRDGGWILKIVGDGPDRQKFEELAYRLNISDSVSFTGWINDPSPIMQSAKLFCITSFFEGFALVIAEAMANGLPVVSYDLPYGPSDIISDGQDGLLIPYLDEDAFAQKLSELMADEDRIIAMSDAAKIKSQQFSVDKITDLWIEKFNDLLANS
jgi:glycosyltransferase involved in cell wall biosynthesis